MSNSEYKDVIQQYKDKKIDFKIELSLARNFLLSGTNDSTKFAVWSFINYIALPIVIIIVSFMSFGVLWGIIFGIVYFLFLNTVTGLSSIDFNKAEFSICIFAIIFIILSIILKFKTQLYAPFMLALVNFVSIYCFYFNIGKTIMNNYILKDEKLFQFLIENNVFIICNKKY